MEAKATTGAEHNFPKTTEIRSEASKIHQENIEKMAQMSEEEILQEREELLKGLDPKLIESLIGRSKKRKQQAMNTMDILMNMQRDTMDGLDQ